MINKVCSRVAGSSGHVLNPTHLNPLNPKLSFQHKDLATRMLMTQVARSTTPTACLQLLAEILDSELMPFLVLTELSLSGLLLL